MRGTAMTSACMNTRYSVLGGAITYAGGSWLHSLNPLPLHACALCVICVL